LLFVVPYCFLGSRVLSRKGTDVAEGDLTQQTQIGDALPLKRSWFASAVVDPRSYLCDFSCGKGRQNNNKRAFPMRRGTPWPIRVCGSCQADRKSLPDRH
jgi:hypothetical protein